MGPEQAHKFTLRLLKIGLKTPGIGTSLTDKWKFEDLRMETNLWGIRFPNPIGLAAGFDKDAKHIDQMEKLGFGFIEIGTVTPMAQEGNPKPRLFRLPKDRALINRMGFNNDGMLAAVERLKNRKSDVIIGGNIGKNKRTPNEDALMDYERAFKELYTVVDYFTVNVSSPNTPGLRELQSKEPLKKILFRLMDLGKQFVAKGHKRRPILLKIAPDLTQEGLDDVIDLVKEVNLDGIVATNTTTSRKGLKTAAMEVENIGNGGLSGAPLTKRSTEIVRYISEKTDGNLPIIASGGVMTPEDVIEKIEAGAKLVQVYTGMIYNGPDLILDSKNKIMQHIAD